MSADTLAPAAPSAVPTLDPADRTPPPAGTEVFWRTPDGWRCGEFVRMDDRGDLAPLPGEPFADVRTSNGRVLVPLGELSWQLKPFVPPGLRDPWTVRRSRWKGRPAEVLTFTGRTESEFDAFCDARTVDGRESLGWIQDGRAKCMTLDSGRFVWCQWRRIVL